MRQAGTTTNGDMKTAILRMVKCDEIFYFYCEVVSKVYVHRMCKRSDFFFHLFSYFNDFISTMIGVFFFQVGGPLTKILVLRNKPVFKGLFIHVIGCEHGQDLVLPFSHVFKQVGHWSTYLEKTPKVTFQL